MTPELESIAVLADRLQADGDPRGELLSIELAATLARSSEESRRFCLAAHAQRAASPELAWPQALMATPGLIRAGLLVSGVWNRRSAPDLPASLGPTCRELVVRQQHGTFGLRSLLGLRLDGLSELRVDDQPASLELDLDPGQSFELASLGIAGPVTNTRALQQMRGLVRLDVTAPQMWPELLAQLPSLALRSLTVCLADRTQLDEILDACPLLEHLTLSKFDPPLEPHPVLERLHSLTVTDFRTTRLQPKLSTRLSLPRLESLSIPELYLHDLELVSALGLRRLTVHDPVGNSTAIIATITKLNALEHLGLLIDNRSNIAPLSGLSCLRSLELGGGTGELHAPSTLERVAFREYEPDVLIRGNIATVQCARKHPGRETIDLAQSTTVGLDTRMHRSRRASLSLPSVETLVLAGDEVQSDWVAWLNELPRLRTVVCPNLRISGQRALSERLPHLQIIGADARLREPKSQSTMLDLLAPSNWPKCE